MAAPVGTSGNGGTGAFEEGQRAILERIAGNGSLAEVLCEIVLLIERQGQGLLCSILLLDRQRGTIHHGAAPNLPRELIEGVDGQAIGPQAGSCGAAAYLGQPVVVEDIATHPNWARYRQLALPFGLRACWSTPIFSPSRAEVLGTFAIYYREPRVPTELERLWVARATHLAAIAISRRQAEERLATQAALLDQAKDAIIVREVDGQVQYWNQGAQRLYGWTSGEAVGRSVLDLIYPDRRGFDQASRRLLDRGQWSGELAQVNKDGNPLIVEGSWTLIRDQQGQPRSVFAIHSDITEKRRLEAQVIRAKRLDSLGSQAGGMAHDFNNLLMIIGENVRMALQELGAEHPARDALVAAEKAVAHGSELTRQILTFSRKQRPTRKSVRLERVVAEALALLRATIPRSIEIQTRFDPEAPEILADPTQIQQIVVNLGNNAAHAMMGTGTLEVSVDRVVLEGAVATESEVLPPGVYARLAIADTGVGMDDATRERIFDPLFTTKPAGEGTGLGLSVVHGIVRGHEGGIIVRSAPGRGAEFGLYFPAAQPAASRALTDASPTM